MNWDEIRKEYEYTDISLIDLATKYDIKYSTIKSRNQRQKWAKKDASRVGFLDASKDASKKKRGGQPGNSNAKGYGAPPGNQNGLGNKGGPPIGSQNARIHGLYAKYTPEAVFNIAKELNGMSVLDVLWGNITLQYAKIIHAQQVMYVVSKDELIKHVKSETESAITYEFQYAWDRQAKDLTSQSKAMSTLNAMIKQYDELCRSELVTEEQRLRIEKLKAEVAGQGGEIKEDPFDSLTTDELREVINND